MCYNQTERLMKHTRHRNCVGAEDDQFLGLELALSYNHHFTLALSVVLPANVHLHIVFPRLAPTSALRLLTCPVRTEPEFPLQYHFRVYLLTVPLDVGCIRSRKITSLDRATAGLDVPLAMFTFVISAFDSP